MLDVSVCGDSYGEFSYITNVYETIVLACDKLSSLMQHTDARNDVNGDVLAIGMNVDVREWIGNI